MKDILDSLFVLWLIAPWTLFLFIHGCYMMFGGRIKVKFIKRQGFIFQIKIRHPRKVIRDWMEGTE